MNPKWKKPAASKPKRVQRKKQVSRVSAPLKNAIQRIVKGNIETKYTGRSIWSAKFVPCDTLVCPASFQYGATCIIPTLAQGLATEERVGGKVNPTSIFVNVLFSFDNAYLNTQDITVKWWVLHCKTAKSTTTLNSLVANTMLDRGDGTTTDWGTDNFVSDCLPINSELFNVEQQGKFKLRKNGGSPNTSTATTPTESLVGGSSTYNHLRFRLKTPKTFIYDDSPSVPLADQLLPTNYMPIMVAVAYASDGQSVISAPALRWSCYTNFYFKDA